MERNDIYQEDPMLQEDISQKLYIEELMDSDSISPEDAEFLSGYLEEFEDI